MKIRLDKFLSICGLGSRREVIRLINSKKIRVNQKIIIDPSFKIDPEKDLIFYEEKPLFYQKFYYYKFYKPKGVITSTKDKETNIFDLLPKDLPGLKELFPAGRLDKDAEGLILLTNDGELAHRVTHPRWKLPKTYIVEIDKPLEEKDKIAIEEGIELKEGKTKPTQITLLNSEKKQLKITVTEGRYHLLKRLFGKRGYKVLSIKRIAIGPIQLEDLKPCEIKKLSEEELLSLRSELFGKFKNKA
jgi:pseudouridine synthase